MPELRSLDGSTWPPELIRLEVDLAAGEDKSRWVEKAIRAEKSRQVDLAARADKSRWVD